MQKKVIHYFNEPSSKLEKRINLFLVFLVYVSIIQLVIEIRYPELVALNQKIFLLAEYLILGFFSIEVGLRIIFDSNRWQYFKTFSGIIDLLSIIPGLLSIFLPVMQSTAWLRVFRLLRIVRITKLIRYGKFMDGITQTLNPYFAIAIGLKGLMVAAEGQEWWPTFNNLNIIIGVVGFSLAILLGAKLQIINNRLYSIEDSICRIVGAMREMQTNSEALPHIRYWAKELESALVYNGKNKDDLIRQMRLKTDALGKELHKAGLGGPNTAGFHRDTAYLLHRALATTPESYEKFLKTIVCVYTVVVIGTVPGLTGFFATFLLVYVLGGLFILIDDIDKPLNYGPESLISVRLDPLTQFNERNE
tara:strand:- start:321 stop:1406 length:1086 start_codon:yes stop_codon:yes gene_type:complete